MIQLWQFNEVSPSAVTGTTASSVAVTGSDPSAAAGIATGEVDSALGLLIVGELHQDSGGTLDVYGQSFVLGVWYDIFHFKQLASGSSSFKYSLVAGPGYTANSVTIGTGTTPALAADSVVGGPWGEKLRLLMVPGAGAAGGAAVKVTLLGQLPRQYGGR
jgi:hypothetical protein